MFFEIVFYKTLYLYYGKELVEIIIFQALLSLLLIMLVTFTETLDLKFPYIKQIEAVFNQKARYMA